jgi:hypothetical protein
MAVAVVVKTMLDLVKVVLVTRMPLLWELAVVAWALHLLRVNSKVPRGLLKVFQVAIAVI